MTSRADAETRRQALMQLGIPDRERDAMIKAMVESSQNVERLEAARPLVQLGRSEQAVPVLREIAMRGSKEDRTQADELLKWDRARRTHCCGTRKHRPTPIGPDQDAGD